MYGNTTSHLCALKAALTFTEIPRQLFKGQRTLWPGKARHLVLAIASEDKLLPSRGEPGGCGAALPGPL